MAQSLVQRNLITVRPSYNSERGTIPQHGDYLGAQAPQSPDVCTPTVYHRAACDMQAQDTSNQEGPDRLATLCNSYQKTAVMRECLRSLGVESLTDVLTRGLLVCIDDTSEP